MYNSKLNEIKLKLNTYIGIYQTNTYYLFEGNVKSQITF